MQCLLALKHIQYWHTIPEAEALADGNKLLILPQAVRCAVVMSSYHNTLSTHIYWWVTGYKPLFAVFTSPGVLYCLIQACAVVITQVDYFCNAKCHMVQMIDEGNGGVKILMNWYWEKFDKYNINKTVASATLANTF